MVKISGEGAARQAAQTAQVAQTAQARLERAKTAEAADVCNAGRPAGGSGARQSVAAVLSTAQGQGTQAVEQAVEQAAADAAALYEEAQKRAREAYAPQEAEAKSLVEMMKEAKERAEAQRERFKLPKNTNYGDAPMQAYYRLAKARTQAQVGSAAGYARSKIAYLKGALRQDPDNAQRIRAAINSLQKAVSRAGRKKRELQQEQITERQRAKAAMRKEEQKAERLRRELNHRRTMRGIRERGYLRECEVENRLQDQLQASRMELRLQMQQLTAAVTPSPEAAAQQYAMQAGGGDAAAPAASVDIQA